MPANAGIAKRPSSPGSRQKPRNSDIQTAHTSTISRPIAAAERREPVDHLNDDYVFYALNRVATALGTDELGETAYQLKRDELVAEDKTRNGTRSVAHSHRELGKLLWDHCGMARNRSGLEKALSEIPALREEFWKDVRVLGGPALNQSLEKAARVADFFELGELMVRDALHREESCGGHFREEHQTPDGEAQRDDANFQHVAAWEYAGDGQTPKRHQEPLEFEYVHPSQRSYK